MSWTAEDVQMWLQRFGEFFPFLLSVILPYLHSTKCNKLTLSFYYKVPQINFILTIESLEPFFFFKKKKKKKKKIRQLCDDACLSFATFQHRVILQLDSFLLIFISPP